MQALFLLWEGVEIDFDRLLAKKKLKKIVTTNSNNNKIVKKTEAKNILTESTVLMDIGIFGSLGFCNFVSITN